MAPVAGRPFLEWLLEALSAAGMTRVLLAVGHRHEQIRSHFGSRFAGLPLDYEIEEEPLGTGGALRKSLERLGPEGEPVFALNGDTFVEVDYAAVWRRHRSTQPRPPLTVVLREVESAPRYGCAELREGRLVRFRSRGGAGPALVNAGVYLLERDLLAGRGWPERFSFERVVLEEGAERLRPLAHRVAGRFVDIGVPESYAEAGKVLTGRGVEGCESGCAAASASQGRPRKG